MASIGTDRDLRFWTYYGCGAFAADIFHDGDIDPANDNRYMFNQSHK